MSSTSGLYNQIQGTNKVYYQGFSLEMVEDFMQKLSNTPTPTYTPSLIVSQDQMTMLTGTEEEKAIVRNKWYEANIRKRLDISREYHIDYDLVFMLCEKFKQSSTNNTWQVSYKSISTGEYDDSYRQLDLTVDKEGNFILEEFESDGYYDSKTIVKLPLTTKEVFELLIIEDYKM